MKILVLVLMQAAVYMSFGQTDSLKIKNLDEVVVSATRANGLSAMAYSNVSKKELNKSNLGQDIPILLNQMQSVLTSSDAGTGVGYTGIRVRGVDPTRINVTLNGIPYNDSESQGVYWVNMPDFASSVQSIQVQRGVGTSTNGAGAFGASINVNTLQYNPEAYADINVSGGSFGTLKRNIALSSGLISDKFIVDTRLSKINSDGFVDRASADLSSYYVSGGYYNRESFVRVNVFGGHEKTYQAWNGIPEALAKADAKGIDEFVARNYYDDAFKKSMLASGRRFNFYNYENEVDDYRQTHYQAISSIKVNELWRFNPTLHYTKGIGFFEQYKADAKLANYSLENVKIGGEEIKKTDLIRRKWLNNDFYGAVWSLENTGNGRFKPAIGGAWNTYAGGHYGEIIWAKYASNSKIRQRYYDNNTQKQDFNVYAKGNYALSEKLNAYIDVQYRAVGFKMDGLADGGFKLNEPKKNYSFLNPKLGLTYQPNKNQAGYISYAKGAKEPSRQDFVDNIGKAPKPEFLNDVEAGYKYNGGKTAIEINAYNMQYKDQLVLTGQINGVGEAIRINVPNSVRRGIEMNWTQAVSKAINFNVNATLSQNKIKNFTQLTVSYDDSPSIEEKFKNKDIAMSPNTILGGQLNFTAIKNLEISLLSKYAGKQYLDNTASESKKLDAYWVNDVRFTYGLKPKCMKELSLTVLINNVLNAKYSSNGYTYSYIAGETVTENFVYPQAGINVLSGVKMRF